MRYKGLIQSFLARRKYLEELVSFCFLQLGVCVGYYVIYLIHKLKDNGKKQTKKTRLANVWLQTFSIPII